ASAIARPMPCPAAVITATLPFRRSIMTLSGIGQGREARPLPSFAIEICGREPAFEGSLARGPFGIEDREPRGVAVPALNHHVLAERPLETEAIALRGAPGCVVARIAFPFIAPVAERFKSVACEQILRLGSEPAALKNRG